MHRHLFATLAILVFATSASTQRQATPLRLPFPLEDLDRKAALITAKQTAASVDNDLQTPTQSEKKILADGPRLASDCHNRVVTTIREYTQARMDAQRQREIQWAEWMDSDYYRRIPQGTCFLSRVKLIIQRWQTIEQQVNAMPVTRLYLPQEFPTRLRVGSIATVPFPKYGNLWKPCQHYGYDMLRSKLGELVFVRQRDIRQPVYIITGKREVAGREVFLVDCLDQHVIEQTIRGK